MEFVVSLLHIVFFRKVHWVLFSIDLLVSQNLIYRYISYKIVSNIYQSISEIHELVSKTCDQAVVEFNNFINSEVTKQQIEFFGFKVEIK